MRRQNPPESNIDEAKKIEKRIASGLSEAFMFAYLLLGNFLIFGIVFLLHSYIPFPFFIATLAIFNTWTLVLRFTSDPFRRSIQMKADKWRRSFILATHSLMLPLRLKQATTVNVEIIVTCAQDWDTQNSRSRIAAALSTELAKLFATNESAPQFGEIQEALEAPIGLIAEELNIPVLYADVRDRYGKGAQTHDVELGTNDVEIGEIRI